MWVAHLGPPASRLSLQFNIRSTPANLVEEAMKMFKQDLKSIQGGEYVLPWDMTTPAHRQFRPSFVAGQAVRYLREATGVLGRKEKGQADPIWMDSGLYPKYYKNAFHFQTDGWMSSRSAQVSVRWARVDGSPGPRGRRGGGRRGGLVGSAVSTPLLSSSDPLRVPCTAFWMIV